MKTEKIKFILIIMSIFLLVTMPQVYAKTSIEIKPNSSTVYTNRTISEFFDESLAMKNEGESLEGSNVDVHMATDTDWAIVAYFSNSAYGTNGDGKNTGIKTTINGQEYLSTNGNVTGVMNFGKTTTYTAGVISNYAKIDSTSTYYTNGKSLIDNATNGKYINLINTLTGKDMAIRGWYESSYCVGSEITRPYSWRSGIFGFIGGTGTNWNKDNDGPTGAAKTHVTFRPVIWN